MAKLIDIYRESKELKRLIINRSNELNIPLKFICMELGLNYHNFVQSYVNSNVQRKFDIDEDGFEKLLSSLGIEVRHQFIINKQFNAEKRRDELRELYNNHINKNGKIS